MIDVRTPAEYATGHLPGAVNVPLDQVLVALAATGAGATWGLGRLWARTPFVDTRHWLRRPPTADRSLRPEKGRPHRSGGAPRTPPAATRTPPYPPRTTATGDGAWCSRAWLTDPSSRPVNPPRPRAPTTVSRAVRPASMSASRVGPCTTLCSTTTPG